MANSTPSITKNPMGFLKAMAFLVAGFIVAQTVSTLLNVPSRVQKIKNQIS